MKIDAGSNFLQFSQRPEVSLTIWLVQNLHLEVKVSGY
jgi:hypothetical protein